MPPVDRFRIGLGNARQRKNTTETEQVEAVERAIQRGYRHIDTAQAYNTEEVIGQAISSSDVSRDELFIATKIHSDYLGEDLIRSAVLERLEALDIDRIDLLYVHWPAGGYDPDETFNELHKLQTEGLIDRIGVCNFTAELLDEAYERTDIFAHQTEYHPLFKQPDLLRHAQEHGTWLIAHTPIARGEVCQVEKLQKIAEAHDATVPQTTLAWLLSKSNVAAIPMASGEHIDENIRSYDIELTRTEIAQINNLPDKKRFVSPDIAPWEA